MKKLVITNERHWNLVQNGFLILFMFLVFNSCNDIEMDYKDTNDVIHLKSSVLPEIAGDLFFPIETFVRDQGKPVTETRILDGNDPDQFAPDFILYLQNGNEEGSKVSSAVVKLDGKQLFGPKDFTQQVELLSVPVSEITSESVLEVEVRGEPGGLIKIWIEGTLLEAQNPYKMYYLSSIQGLMGVTDNGSRSELYQYEGRMSAIQAYNQKLYVNTQTFDLTEGAVHVLDLNGNLLEILEFPEEVTYSSAFTILPDGKFAVYNNRTNTVYFLNPDFTFITQVSFMGSQHQQNMRGVVVGNDLIISEDGQKNLLKVDLTTYEISTFRSFSHLQENWIGAITYANGTFYLCAPTNIYSFKAGEAENLLVSLPINNNVAIEIDGNYAYVGSFFGGKIYKINLTDGSYSDYVFVPQVLDIEWVR